MPLIHEIKQLGYSLLALITTLVVTRSIYLYLFIATVST